MTLITGSKTMFDFVEKLNYINLYYVQDPNKVLSDISNLQNVPIICQKKNKKIVRKIPDMGGDGENLGKLVDLLNELQPEPSQLDYIIEDYLTFFDV